MKKLTLLTTLLLSAGAACAQTAEAPASQTLAAAGSGRHRHFSARQQDSTQDVGATLLGKAPGPNTRLTDRLFPNSFSSALTQGTGIVAFAYDGSATATVAIDQTFAPTWTGKHTFSNAVTASSGAAQGAIFSPTLTAAANNDFLAAIDIAPTFVAGSFTGVHNTAIRANYASLGQNTADGFILRNPTAATSSVQQYSPAITWMSNAWNTGSAISEGLNYRMYVSTASGSYLSSGTFNIDVSQNGGAYGSKFKMDPYGNIVLTGYYSSYTGLTTSNDGVILLPGSVATAASPTVMSGRMRFDASGWNTSSSSAQSSDFIIENKPASGSAVTARLAFSTQLNGGGYTERFGISNTGLFSLNGTALTANQLIGANAGASGMEAKSINGSATTGLTVTGATGAINLALDTTVVQTVANFFPKADTRYLRTLNNVTAGGDLTGTLQSPTVAKFNGQLPAYYLNYANLTGTPTNLSQFTNDLGFLTAVTPTQITAALGFTPYNGATNPNGYLTAVTPAQVSSALGYTAANDNQVVHLAGSETITGAKTFNGNVGIGTGTLPSGYVFAVNGNTIATSVTVKAYANWADYVFDAGYQLKPLPQVAAYIQQNHHLEDIPTTAEVARDGQNLGDMNTKLLKKVEELTLYLIDKDQELKKEQAKVDELEARLKKIEDQLQDRSGH